MMSNHIEDMLDIKRKYPNGTLLECVDPIVSKDTGQVVISLDLLVIYTLS